MEQQKKIISIAILLLLQDLTTLLSVLSVGLIRGKLIRLCTFCNVEDIYICIHQKVSRYLIN